MSTTDLDLSIIAPAHNEEKIIESFVESATKYLKNKKLNGEVIIVENGSTDRTLELLKELSKSITGLVIFHQDKGNKGLALKKGMLAARGALLVTLDVDLWDSKFVDESLLHLINYDVVVGSKSIRGSKDNRPFSSRLFNRAYNLIFKVVFNFKGTETHAKLSFKKDEIVSLVEQCKSGDLVFDTELIIRAERAGLNKIELPTQIDEIRPRVWSFNKQLVNTIRNFILLFKVLGPSPNIPYLLLLLSIIVLLIWGVRLMFLV